MFSTNVLGLISVTQLFVKGPYRCDQTNLNGPLTILYHQNSKPGTLVISLMLAPLLAVRLMLEGASTVRPSMPSMRFRVLS